MMVNILMGVFIVATLIQLIYAVYFFVRIFQAPSAPSNNLGRYDVSLVICAKDAAEQLKKNLPQFLNQDSQGIRYDVLVVNDASTDHTMEVLETLQATHKNLRVLTIDPNETRPYPGKKTAWVKGIEEARYDNILLSDADCAPTTDQWLKSMSAPLIKGKKLVVGYGAYTLNNGFLNAFVRFETQHTFMQYASYWLAGVPYMAVGRNMGGKKSFLQSAIQHPAFAQLPSGDDDLLVQLLGNSKEMEVLWQQNSFTTSEAPKTWPSYFSQKQRHVSTGKYYPFKIKALLAGYAFSHVLFWVLLFIIPFVMGKQHLMLFQSVAAVRIALYLILHTQLSKKLSNHLATYTALFADLLWAFYNVFLSPFIFFKNKQTWK